MALSRTVAQFLTDMRQRSDNEGTSALDRFPDPECILYLNRAVWAFHRIVVESRGGNYKVSAVSVPTVSGTSVYALDAAFYRLLNVNATLNGHKIWLDSFDENERAQLSDANNGWSGQPFKYSLVGSNIELLPTPTAVYTIEVRFVPDPPTLVAGNSYDAVNGDGVNFIVDTAAGFMASKDENWELYNSLKSSAATCKEALEMSLPNRDQNTPPRIQNVRPMSRFGSRRVWGR